MLWNLKYITEISASNRDVAINIIHQHNFSVEDNRQKSFCAVLIQKHTTNNANKTLAISCFLAKKVSIEKEKVQSKLD